MKRNRIHVHKVERVDLSKSLTRPYIVFKCREIGCTSYYILMLVVGMNVKCWGCNETFTFQKRNLRQVKPRCYKCTGDRVGQKEEEKQVPDDVLQDILNKLK